MAAPRPDLHMPLNGNLAGKAGGAPVVADGYGALRWRDADLAGRQCALVEEAGMNLLPNPSFEVDLTGWTQRGAGTTTSQVTADAIAGSASIEIVGATDTSGITSANSSVTVAQNDVMTATAYMGRRDGPSLGLSVGIIEWTSGGGYLAGSASTPAVPIDYWERRQHTRTIASPTSARASLYTTTNAVGAMTWVVDATQLERADHASSYIDGSLGDGYAWLGTPHNSASTRALTTIEIPYTGAIERIFCRYSEDWGATWHTASLTEPDTFGDYAVIDYADDTLTIESSRALLIRDLAVYAEALDSEEIAAVEQAIENGTFGRRSGYWPGLLLPV